MESKYHERVIMPVYLLFVCILHDFIQKTIQSLQRCTCVTIKYTDQMILRCCQRASEEEKCEETAFLWESHYSTELSSRQHQEGNIKSPNDHKVKTNQMA